MDFLSRNLEWIPYFTNDIGLFICEFKIRGNLPERIYRELQGLPVQCSPLNGITLGRRKSDNNNRMIQLTDVFCALFIYNWASHI